MFSPPQDLFMQDNLLNFANISDRSMAKSSNIIRIPKADFDAKIVEVLLAMFSIMSETEECGQSVTWDFREIESLHPFFISALAVFKDSFDEEIQTINICENLNKKLDDISFKSPVLFENNHSPKPLLDPYKAKGLSPICKFSCGYTKIDEMQTELFSIIAGVLRNRVRGWRPDSAVSYLLSELICNIQEHSHASHGFMFVQCPEGDDYLSICIADNGITIHGSYLNSNKPEIIRLIGPDHAEAIRYSTKGISTKDRPFNERGYGISTNLNMVVNGLGGAFFLMSGQAFYRSDEEGEQFVNLPQGLHWDGTIILVKIPLKQDTDFNVYNFIE